MNMPQPANLADPAFAGAWPKGSSCALMLGFDVDAESVWLSFDSANEQRLVTMSYGGYEPRVGTPRILQLLSDMNLRGTFFVTGWAADAHPGMVDAIAAGGHEIAHHGYMHTRPEPGQLDAMEREIDRGFEALARRGVTPVGYRAPLGESFEGLLKLLSAKGIRYSSSWRDDIRPYRHRHSDGTKGPLELPVTFTFDDWLYGLTHRQSPRSLFTREHVLSIWKDEFDETRNWGGMVNTVLHPQVSGRPMRLRILREFLEHVVATGDTWIATGTEIADHVEAQNL